jgi:type IV secretory pathway VirB10-like protein
MRRSAATRAWSRSTPLAAALLAASAAGGCMSTSTYGTGESPELAIFREVAGGIPLVGVKKKEKIEYQPRAPLVRPPSAGALAPPVETAAVANPQWPEQAKDDEPRYKEGELRDEVSPAEYRRLKPLAALNRPRSAGPGPDSELQNAAYDIIGKKKQQEEVRAAMADAEGFGRTERRYLTDLPEALREPAPTAPVNPEPVKKKRWFWGG